MSTKFSLLARLKKAEQVEADTRSLPDVAAFVSRMRQEDDMLLVGERHRSVHRVAAKEEIQAEYESSLTMAHRQIKMLEEALHNEKLISETLRRKLAIYETTLPQAPPALFPVSDATISRPSSSVTEWRLRLDEVQKSQLDRLTGR